jgi:hypothetical protein
VDKDTLEFESRWRDNVAFVRIMLVGVERQAVIETRDGKMTAEINLKRVWASEVRALVIGRMSAADCCPKGR